jgi:hypothetical protein
MSRDVSFDDTYSSVIATTWHHFHYRLLLQPSNFFILDPDTILEETGTIDDLTSLDTSIEEGCLTSYTSGYFYFYLHFPMTKLYPSLLVIVLPPSIHSAFIVHLVIFLLTLLRWLMIGVSSPTAVMKWN